MQSGYRDFWAVVLEPDIGANFTSDFLIGIPLVDILSHPMWQWKTEKTTRVLFVINIDWDANIECPREPLPWISSAAACRTQVEMVCHYSLDDMALSKAILEIFILLIQ